MAKAFTVPMAEIIEENGLETVYMPSDPAHLMISCSDVNRPGLALGDISIISTRIVFRSWAKVSMGIWLI